MRLPRPEPRRGRIEIIPMIDTIFFLLVYFIMISLSMVHMAMHGVHAPGSTAARQRIDAQLVISITRDGTLYLDRQQLTEADLLPAVRARLRDDANLAIVLNCDKARSVDSLLRVYDLVKQANARTVMIATTPMSLAKDTP